MKRVIAVLISAAALLLSVGAATAQASIAPGQSTVAPSATTGPFEFVNYNSGQCLGVKGTSLSNNVNLIQSACGNASFNDRWYLVSAGSGWYFLQNTLSGKCAMPYQSALYVGAPVVQYSCGAPATEWKFYSSDYAGYQFLYNLNSHLCLNVKDGSTVDGALITQTSCGSSHKSDLWTY